jgi:hypothetical protein
MDVTGGRGSPGEPDVHPVHLAVEKLLRHRQVEAAPAGHFAFARDIGPRVIRHGGAEKALAVVEGNPQGL